MHAKFDRISYEIRHRRSAYFKCRISEKDTKKKREFEKRKKKIASQKSTAQLNNHFLKITIIKIK